MISDFDSVFDDVRRAPRRPAREAVMKTKALIRKAAESVVRKCLDGQPGGFSTREIFDQVAEFSGSYTSPNALGTALGDGVRGSGLGLHRDEAGKFRRCRDNAALALTALGAAERELLARELSFSETRDLFDAIDRLPPAPPTPSK